jgi:hypothetical protein
MPIIHRSRPRRHVSTLDRHSHQRQERVEEPVTEDDADNGLEDTDAEVKRRIAVVRAAKSRAARDLTDDELDRLL